MTRLAIFTTLAGLGAAMLGGQTLSSFKTLPGPENHGSTMLVDASGVYSFNTESVRRYDLEGTLVWSQEQPRGETIAWLASTSAGVYAAGHTSPPLTVGTEAFVRLYDLQGTKVWTQFIKLPDARSFNSAIAADETGVYVAGAGGNNLGTTTSYLRKFDPRGNELWTKTSIDVRRIAVDSTGVYVRAAGSVRKLDRSGNEVWARAVENDNQMYDLKANATGVYFTGYSTANKQYFLARYDSNGNQIWTSYGQSGWIALDANSAYVTAFTYREPGQCASGHGDAFVVRYDLDGKVLWTRQFGSYEPEYPQAIAATASGVFVTGFGFGRLFLGKLDPALLATSPSEPRITNECVVNAASNVGGAVSPGEIITIFGTAIGPSQLVAARVDRTVGTELAETRVLFDGLPAPLLYTSAGQVGAIVPNSVASKASVGIQVEYRGVLSRSVTLPVLKSHAGIFSRDASGTGQAAALNEDGTPNSQANPARRGSIISIFATGGGETSPATTDGQIVGIAAPLKATASLYLGEDPATEESIFGPVSDAGAVPGAVAGLLQVNARIPETLSTGSVLAILIIDTQELAYPESVRIWIQ